jgi:hypothetical protein
MYYGSTNHNKTIEFKLRNSAQSGSRWREIYRIRIMHLILQYKGENREKTSQNKQHVQF